MDLRKSFGLLFVSCLALGLPEHHALGAVAVSSLDATQAQTTSTTLQSSRKAWSDFDLAAGKNQLFKSDGDQVNNIFIKVATNGKGKEYKLASGNRYAIKWNEKTNKWDVSKLKPAK